MYVYGTAEFQEKLGKYGLQERFDEIRRTLEGFEEIHTMRALFQPFPPYCKKREGRLRLLGRVIRVQDVQVLCLIDVYERRDPDYVQFIRDPRGFGEKHLDPLLNYGEVEKWLIQQREAHPIPELVPLPDELRSWLQPPRWEIESETKDTLIYESDEWTKRFRNNDVWINWKTYHGIVSSILNDQIENISNVVNKPGLMLASKEDFFVLFSEIETCDKSSRRVLFLLAPFDHEPNDEEVTHVLTAIHPFYAVVSPTFQNSSSMLTLDDLAALSRRSYPDYLLADGQYCWLPIEREQESNLALSAEEEQLLRSASNSLSTESALPIFINGRAGSGKSTMLYYLFADYCFRKIQQSLPGEPLFLTYNDQLLQVAKAAVHRLLESHHRFLAQTSAKEKFSSVDTYFRPFQRFLIELLPPEQRARFSAEKYISFFRFKQLYNQEPLRVPMPKDSKEREKIVEERQLVLKLPNATNWSPELSWHAIRAFIKGYRLDDYLEPDDYHEVPRRERTISDDTFKQIYETIWDRWYLLITKEQGYWDDQDLVRKVLLNKISHPDYAAIFCDEAQDFTRLELQLVMRLSLFSKYDLEFQPVHNLPFAFAGDPFQTLNPSGFRWSSVQAAFYDEVITALNPTKSWNLRINFQELRYNYRSTSAIVRASNLIQLWRHGLFDLAEIESQITWQKDRLIDPVRFILGQNISPAELKQIFENTIVIIPCEEGQEISFVQNDTVLSQIFPQASLENPPKNVLSSIKAKGLEFKRVILYKFGEACDESVWKLLHEPEEHPVEFEYFFNKLYVAASRAMERLFVIDSPEGDERLWKRMSDHEHIELLLRKAKNSSAWDQNIQTIGLGAPQSAKEMYEDDPGSIAQEFKSKGFSLSNSDFLRRAKQYFNIIGDSFEAGLCESWALRFEERYSEAGKSFLKQGQVDDAWESLWEGVCWEDLVDWYGRFPESKKEGREIAVFMIANPKDTGALNSLTQYVRMKAEAKDLPDSWSKQWRSMVSEYLLRISNLNREMLTPNSWEEVGNVLEKLDASGFQGTLVKAGECFYRAGNYRAALKCWEQSGVTETNEVFLAKSKIVGMPEGLAWLERANASEQILDEWDYSGGLNHSYDPRWLNIFAPALESKGRNREAFRVYVNLNDPDRVIRIFEKAIADPETNLWDELQSLLDFLIRRDMWTKSIDVFERYFPKVIGHSSGKARFHSALVREIAYSQQTPEDLTSDQRQKLEDFVTSQVLSAVDWQSRLTTKEVGAALERLGGFVSALRFYERFVDTRDSDLRRFSRERWIATKRRQLSYYERLLPEKERADRTRRELGNTVFNWNQDRLIGYRLDMNMPLPEFPELPSRAMDVVKGLPTTTRIEDLGVGSLRFQVGDIEVRTNKTTRLVLITHTKTFETVRVDLEGGEINGRVDITGEGESKREFQAHSGGYSGVLFYGGDKARLELRIHGVTDLVTVEL